MRDSSRHTRAMRSMFQNQLTCYSCSSNRRLWDVCEYRFGLFCHSGWSAKILFLLKFLCSPTQVPILVSRCESSTQSERRMLIVSTLTCRFIHIFSCFHPDKRRIFFGQCSDKNGCVYNASSTIQFWYCLFNSMPRPLSLYVILSLRTIYGWFILNFTSNVIRMNHMDLDQDYIRNYFHFLLILN